MGWAPLPQPTTTKEITDMPDDITKRIARFIRADDPLPSPMNGGVR